MRLHVCLQQREGAPLAPARVPAAARGRTPCACTCVCSSERAHPMRLHVRLQQIGVTQDWSDAELE
eukprot:287926-Chlamydomonas_euryale.AAC.2